MPLSEDAVIALVGAMAAIIGAIGGAITTGLKTRQGIKNDTAEVDQRVRDNEVDRLQEINRAYYEEVKALQEQFFTQSATLRDLSCKYDVLARDFAAVKLENQRLTNENRLLKESLKRLRVLETENVDLKARIEELEKRTGGTKPS